METINEEIKETIGEAQEAYEGYQKLTQNKVDEYLDSGNKLRVDIKKLFQRFEKLNNDFLSAVNTRSFPINSTNIEKLEKEINELNSIGKDLIHILKNSPFFPVIESLVKDLEGEINQINETLHDVKSILDLSEDQEIHDLLS